jgi:DNA-binding transcriptional ArsR family regulator
MVAQSAAKLDVFKALSDGTRRAILDLIREHPRPVNDLAHAFPVSRPAISKHLRVLRSAQLIKESRKGRIRLYELNPRPLREVDRWIDEYRIFWGKSLTNLKKYVEHRRKQDSGN